MIPDHIVKAYLIEILSLSEGFKKQLFGESLKIDSSLLGTFQMQATPTLGTSDGPTITDGGIDTTELHALKAQLGQNVQKIDELNKIIAGLQHQNATLQSQPAAAAGDNKALLDKIQALESRLSEYSVIEDDLANLKRYMQENRQLKEQLTAKGITPIELSPTPTPAAPTPVAVPVAAAPEPAPIPIAQPTGASVQDPTPIPIPAAQSTPAAAPTPPAAVPLAGEKSDADLLNEFERMLNS